MIALNTSFPKFVPDQLLTSDDLNKLFGYLEEQGRLTRVNLIGIGIACGLEVHLSSDKSELTISKGCGITSEGYLINFDERIYTDVKVYDPVKPVYYNRFVNTADKTQKMPLWELKQEATTGETTKLSDFSLDDMVVLLFVELLEEQNKNCNPDSCDDKGVKVNVTVRPLLVANIPENEPHFSGLHGMTGNPSDLSPASDLPVLRMPRYGLGATPLQTTADIFNAYLSVLNSGIISRLQSALNSTYNSFSSFVEQDFPTNPFSDFTTKFQFLGQSGLSAEVLVHLQYYYDVVSDILLAYEELRKIGMSVLSLCTPDNNLFPRHLLLGKVNGTDAITSSNRHYFVYSPLFEKRNLVLELRSLFRRLNNLINNVNLPRLNSSFSGGGSGLRITPSLLQDAPLSNKAIPYYYTPSNLYKNWNFRKSLEGRESSNLSYNAESYNTDPTDAAYDGNVNPLSYDLEPYDFLRVEGLIGQDVKLVLGQLEEIIAAKRLPFTVVSLKATEASLSSLESYVSCNFKDLEISYDIARREWEAVIGKTIEYLNKEKTAIRELTDTSNYNQLINYIILLQKAKGWMVDFLSDFAKNYEAFLGDYEAIEDKSKSLIAHFSVKLNGFDPVQQKQEYILTENLIDHFDAVIFSCLKGPFRALYQDFSSRLEESYAKIFFGNFAKKHPGIQHKSGVSMGGTFVLVYHDATKTLSGRDPLAQAIYEIENRAVIADFFLPYTCCSEGGSIQLVVQEMPPAPNKGPQANAGEDRTITAGEDLLLDGTASIDPDGSIISYQWRQVSGAPEAIITTPEKATTAVEHLGEGEYVFELAVKDNKEATDQDTVTVVVTSVPKSCGDLQEIIDDFNRLEETDDRFDNFVNELPIYRKIENFFSLMEEEGVSAFSREKQLQFFQRPFVFERLFEWIEKLEEFLQLEFSLLSLALLRILVRLATYIMCLNPKDMEEDFGGFSPKEFWRLVLSIVEGLDVSNFGSEQMDQLVMLRNMLRNEVKRISENNEDETKPAYLEMLNKTMEILNTKII